MSTSTSTQAFLGDATLKPRLLEEIGKHEAADAITKGLYGEARLDVSEFKGCAIGCALHSMNAIRGVQQSVDDHCRFPSELGIPIELAYHIDTMFENLSNEEARTWPRRVIEAIPVGANLDHVVPMLLQWMILDPTEGFIARAKPEFHDAYRRFAALVDRDWQDLNSVTGIEWNAINNALIECDVWAWAWAGARAGAWAWARAEAWAGARAWAYTALSAQTLRLLREAK